MLLALQYYVALQVYILILFKTTHQKNIAKKKKKVPKGHNFSENHAQPHCLHFFPHVAHQIYELASPNGAYRATWQHSSY